MSRDQYTIEPIDDKNLLDAKRIGEKEAEINRVTDEELAAIESLRSRGFAVTVFAPSEIGNANPKAVENSMVERGWQTINMEGE